ncbi:hypothetical protein, partial [Pseudomonas sp. PDM13]|uniref:hypothetical protein n=1 Tax=Pseudomonas sp. PDM13 TaxID=2769255 RepID=UPI0021E0CAC5
FLSVKLFFEEFFLSTQQLSASVDFVFFSEGRILHHPGTASSCFLKISFRFNNLLASAERSASARRAFYMSGDGCKPPF